jgi:hypothetical protein
VGAEVNMNFYMKQKIRDLARFTIDILLSGFIIHASLFWAYYSLYKFTDFRIALPAHLGLMISYGLFYHFFLNWLPKSKKVEVSVRGRREENI